MKISFTKHIFKQWQPIVRYLRINCEHGILKNIHDDMDCLEDLAQLVEASIVDEPPITVREGGMIRDGYNEEVDRLRRAKTDGKQWLAELEEREKEAATKLFGMLEGEQGAEIRALWDEFEAAETPEAKYANAIDRIQPLLLNYLTNGHTWKLGSVTSAQVYKRMDIIRTATPELWNIVEGVIKDSIEKGILKP